MTSLRTITDKYNLTLLLIHHTRKMGDADPLNTLSGSMGLVGSIDGVLVLEKEKRSGDDAKLTIANRDTEGFCFKLRFNADRCKWDFVCNDGEQAGEEADEKDEWLVMLIDEFLKDAWSGTDTELCDALKAIGPEADVVPLTILRRLKSSIGLFKKSNIGIAVEKKREGRTITLTRIKEEKAEGEQEQITLTP